MIFLVLFFSLFSECSIHIDKIEVEQTADYTSTGFIYGEFVINDVCTNKIEIDIVNPSGITAMDVIIQYENKVHYCLFLRKLGMEKMLRKCLCPYQFVKDFFDWYVDMHTTIDWNHIRWR